MLPALLTTLLWSVSVVCATRSARYLGSAVAGVIALTAGKFIVEFFVH